MKLVLFGDIFLGGDLATHWYKDADFTPFVSLEKITTQADIVFADLETSFFRGELRPRRSGHLFSPPESITSLKKLNLTVVGMANNHSFDFGTNAMLRTKQWIKKHNIHCIGAGVTLEEATQSCIIERDGKKIAFLAYADNTFNVRAIVASRFSVGCAPMNEKQIKRDIERLRKEVDLICIGLHWGFEFLHLPDTKQCNLAKKIIQWGGDVIIGSHPHVVQGYEFINDRPVFYSLGNFIFPEYETLNGKKQTWQTVNNQSIAIELEIDFTSKIQFKVNVIPLIFKFPSVELMQGTEKESFEENLTFWNDALNGKIDTKNFVVETLHAIAKRKRQWKTARIKSWFIHILKELSSSFLGTYKVERAKYWFRKKQKL